MTPLEAALLIAAAVGYLLGAVAYGAHLLLRQPALAVTGRLATSLPSACTRSPSASTAPPRIKRRSQPPPRRFPPGPGPLRWPISPWNCCAAPRRPRWAPSPCPPPFCASSPGPGRGRRIPAFAAATLLLNSRLTTLHILAILFAFGLLVLAFGCAALYLAQDRMLKRKRLSGGLFGKLPPLARLDQLAFTLVAFAFPSADCRPRRRPGGSLCRRPSPVAGAPTRWC